MPHPLWLRTDDHGVARAEGLPSGKYEVVHMGGSEPDARYSTQLDGGSRFIVRVRLDVWPLDAAPALPSTELAADALISIRSGGCFGGLCTPYRIDAFRDGSVRLSEEGRPIRVRHLGKRAISVAVARAQCLARGPSYEARQATDGQTWELRVRDGQHVGVYRHDSHDFRAPRELDRAENRVLRSLRIPQRLRR